MARAISASSRLECLDLRATEGFRSLAISLSLLLTQALPKRARLPDLDTHLRTVVPRIQQE